MVAYYPQPTLYEQNPTWPEINRQLNANIQMSLVTGSDYTVKVGTVIARGDLPDIIHTITALAPRRTCRSSSRRNAPI